MKVDLIDHMGSDLTVVNAARVSFDKASEYDYDPHEQCWVLKNHDEKLLQYLAKHNHWTPFAHCAVTFRVKAPLFVARQLGKHQVGLVWNEVSRRYVDSEPEFYEPLEWRKRAENVKQGSSGEVVTGVSNGSANRWCLEVYRNMLEDGVCPEQARMVLPQSMYTEWYWTGSLAAFARVCNLRLDPHTQRETQEIAKMLGKHMERLFPKSWAVLIGGGDD